MKQSSFLKQGEQIYSKKNYNIGPGQGLPEWSIWSAGTKANTTHNAEAYQGQISGCLSQVSATLTTN